MNGRGLAESSSGEGFCRSYVLGSFDCECNDGYTGDGFICEEGCTCDQAPNWTGVGLLLIAILWRRRRSQLADRR